MGGCSIPSDEWIEMVQYHFYGYLYYIGYSKSDCEDALCNINWPMLMEGTGTNAICENQIKDEEMICEIFADVGCCEWDGDWCVGANGQDNCFIEGGSAADDMCSMFGYDYEGCQESLGDCCVWDEGDCVLNDDGCELP